MHDRQLGAEEEIVNGFVAMNFGFQQIGNKIWVYPCK